MSYVIKELTDVFTHEFSLYIMSTTQGGMHKKYLELIMREVKKFEDKHNLQFVNISNGEFIIFREM